MKCPHCNNDDIEKMTKVAMGKRIYCHCCHKSFLNPGRPIKAPVKKERVVVSHSSIVKFEIKLLRDRLAALEKYIERAEQERA